ncbi:MAG: hypothetical protein HYV13_03915 [Candidatus Doudnabacteria bacterium]|nr:hypothetical protein [Candidatus Doudnabacteria bacterium]
MKRPTPPIGRQVDFLRERGIEVPPTLRVAASLISYIEMGNGTGGTIESERIAILKSAQEQYVGKTVRSRAYGNPGTVLYLYALSGYEVRDMRRHGGRPPRPFKAVVRWQAGGRAEPGTRPVSIADLEVGHTA